MINKTLIIRDNNVYSFTKEKANGVTTVTLTVASEDDIEDEIKQIFKIAKKGAQQ